MSLRNKKFLVLFLPVIIVLVLDQITKQWVRTNPELHRVDVIEGWLAFNFTKNPGMAMGMDWLSTPMISIVAIIATIAILTYILFTIREANFGYLLCMGLILGGAVGNIADRIFMARVGGYGGVLDGHVVDFIHFNLTIGDTPVFPYIFNVADIAITTSIIAMLVFHKKIMPDQSEETSVSKATETIQNKATEESASPENKTFPPAEKLSPNTGLADESDADLPSGPSKS